MDVDIRDLVATDITADAPLEPADRAVLRTFVLDRRVTRDYQQSLTSEGELSPARIAAHCCYSHCEPLDDLAGWRTL
jgi:hypothetical protein